MVKRGVLWSVCVAVWCAPALAQGAPNNPHLRYSQEYNWTFSEIGDVGNAPVTVDSWHPPSSTTRQAGSVGYRYRISTTEVTWGQYYEFVQAHARTVPANIRDGIVARDSLPSLTGGSGSAGSSPITYLGPGPNGEGTYTFDQSRANEPATSTWHYFARMVNWLHNGKPDVDHAVASDFEQGVYDTATFARISDGPKGASYRTDQDRRASGARFWIPSGDELLKATFYDPNKDGNGSAGYWSYGNSSDTLPVPGDPAQGGETNAGVDQTGFGLKQEWPEGVDRPLDVGSYASEQSPWGLLDGAGGGAEWTEEWSTFFDGIQQSRICFPGKAYSPLAFTELGEWRSASPTDYLTLRLAAASKNPYPNPPSSDGCVNGWDASLSGLEAAVYDFEIFDDGRGDGPALYAAGSFYTPGPDPVIKIGRFYGERWETVGGGADSSVRCLTTFDDGTGDALYAAGQFSRIGEIDANAIARWNGESWTALGQGVTGATPQILAACVFDDMSGEGSALYVAGTFTMAGGVPVSNIAKWNGASWSAVGGGFDDTVFSLKVWDDGRGEGPALYAAGEFTHAGGVDALHIAKWDGKSWTSVGEGIGPLYGFVLALESFNDGSGSRLYAGGEFAAAGGQPASRIASWDGSVWSPLGGGVSFPVWTLRAIESPGLPLGLYVGGEFNYVEDTAIDRIARWDGSVWHALGGGLDNAPLTMEVLPSASTVSLLVGGAFTRAGAGAASAVAVWSTCDPMCPGDSNADQRVDFSDLNAVLTAFGQSGEKLPADLNRDRIVNADDLMIVLGSYGHDCASGF